MAMITLRICLRLCKEAQRPQPAHQASQPPTIYQPALSSCATLVKYGSAEGPILWILGVPPRAQSTFCTCEHAGQKGSLLLDLRIGVPLLLIQLGVKVIEKHELAFRLCGVAVIEKGDREIQMKHVV